jgi:glycosyl transferase family 87
MLPPREPSDRTIGRRTAGPPGPAACPEPSRTIVIVRAIQDWRRGIQLGPSSAGRIGPAGADRAAARRRALRHGLAIAGVIAAAWMYLVVGDATWRHPAADGLIYWAVNPADPYPGATVGGKDAYLYSPAFAQVFWLIGRLPREVFIVGWTLLLAVVAVWLARPWPASLLVLALPVSEEVMIGNIHLLLAAAIVIGFRWSGTWAFTLLTKVTPGVGLVWFAARSEWRALIVAATATASVAAISFILAPGVWADWFRLLRSDGGSESSRLLLRLGAAAAIAAWGAITDRRWTVPLAAMMALPIVWMDSFSMLLGCVALSRDVPASGRPSWPFGRPRPIESQAEG